MKITMTSCRMCQKETTSPSDHSRGRNRESTSGAGDYPVSASCATHRPTSNSRGEFRRHQTVRKRPRRFGNHLIRALIFAICCCELGRGKLIEDFEEMLQKIQNGDKNDKDDVRSFIIEEGNMNKRYNIRGEDGRTLLMYAAMHSGWAVKFLLDHAVDVDAADDKGLTALMWAAKKGRADTVRTLLGKVADMNATDVSGFTALMWAAMNGHDAAVKALLEKRANVSMYAVNKWGKTVQNYANSDIKEILKSYGFVASAARLEVAAWSAAEGKQVAEKGAALSDQAEAKQLAEKEARRHTK